MCHINGLGLRVDNCFDTVLDVVTIDFDYRIRGFETYILTKNMGTTAVNLLNAFDSGATESFGI